MFRSMSKKKWKGYPLEWDKDGNMKEVDKSKVTVHENKNYIPKTERPNWCKKSNKKLLPQYRCLCHRGKQCPFFAYTDADKKSYKIFNAVYNKIIDEEQKKWEKKNLI